MAKKVISDEVAILEFNKILDFWEIEIDNSEESRGNKEKVINAIKRGRLTFDEEKEVFKYKLRKPVEQENKDFLNELVLREPIARELTSSSEKNQDNVFKMTVKLISNSSGIPIGIVERIGMKDLTVIGSLMAFFG